MAIKDTTKHMRDLLNNIGTDLNKAENGNKAASQRVRTATVKLEKVAKAYRKESISSEKKNKGTKKPAKKAAASKAKPSKSKPAHKLNKPTKKAGKSVASARALSFKRNSKRAR
jgi:DNA-binding protein H-NS